MPKGLNTIEDYVSQATRERRRHDIEGLVPILDLSNAFKEDTHEVLLESLRKALFEIGFFYIKNVPSKRILGIFKDIKREALDFFSLTPEQKAKVSMLHSKHFLGYNGIGGEITDSHIDWRELYELATELPEPIINNEDEMWKNVEGPNIWPDKADLPNFRPIVEEYIEELTALSRMIIDLIREALKLPEGAFDKYFKDRQQCKLNLIKYPDIFNQKNTDEVIKQLQLSLIDLKQGVGEHLDTNFLTIIFQATKHISLQVQNFEGKWVNVPPIDNTFVVNVGQLLEYITNGVCVATIHRVLTPIPGEGDRLSVAFFQSIDFASYKLKIEIPAEIQEKAEIRDSHRKVKAIGFQFSQDGSKPIGHSVFLNKIKSFPEVAKSWYPNYLEYVKSHLDSVT